MGYCQSSTAAEMSLSARGSCGKASTLTPRVTSLANQVGRPGSVGPARTTPVPSPRISPRLNTPRGACGSTAPAMEAFSRDASHPYPRSPSCDGRLYATAGTVLISRPQTPVLTSLSSSMKSFNFSAASLAQGLRIAPGQVQVLHPQSARHWEIASVQPLPPVPHYTPKLRREGALPTRRQEGPAAPLEVPLPTPVKQSSAPVEVKEVPQTLCVGVPTPQMAGRVLGVAAPSAATHMAPKVSPLEEPIPVRLLLEEAPPTSVPLPASPCPPGYWEAVAPAAVAAAGGAAGLRPLPRCSSTPERQRPAAYAGAQQGRLLQHAQSGEAIQEMPQHPVPELGPHQGSSSGLQLTMGQFGLPKPPQERALRPAELPRPEPAPRPAELARVQPPAESARPVAAAPCHAVIFATVENTAATTLRPEPARVEQASLPPLPEPHAQRQPSQRSQASEALRERQLARAHVSEAAMSSTSSAASIARMRGSSSASAVQPVVSRSASASSNRGPQGPPEELTITGAAAAVSQRDLAELRSFRNPPAVVCQVMEAVALLLGVPDPRWAKVRKLLDNNFTQRVCTLDPGTVSWAQFEKLRLLLQVPCFSDGSLGERCPAVVALAHWCNAVGRFLEEKPPPPPSSRREPVPLGRSRGAAVSEDSLDASRCETEAPQVPAPARHRKRPELSGLRVVPDLWSMSEEELRAVSNLHVSRDGVVCVTFHGETDCREILHRLAELVLLGPGEVVVYPNQTEKPPVGVGLNKPASITMYGCHPKTTEFRDSKAREKYKKRVRLMTEEKGAEFVDYDCDQGVWQFRVSQF